MSDARELAELISSGEAVPASGWVAGVSAALAAALVAKAAKRSAGWSEAAGCLPCLPCERWTSTGPVRP